MSETSRELRVLRDAELRAADNGKAIAGYAALFNSNSHDLGGFTESIEPGAFAEAIKSSDTRALWNHDPNFVLGRSSAGTLRLLETRVGLQAIIEPPDATWARDLMASIRRGDVREMSFGFRLAKGGDRWETRSTGRHRVITKVGELLDVSAVSFPAYPETTVALRSIMGSDVRIGTYSRTQPISPVQVVGTAIADNGDERERLRLRLRLRQLGKV